MAYSTQLQYRIGQQAPVFWTETATQAGDTLTVLTSPAPTFTLYDVNENPVSGLNAVPLSGYSIGAQAVASVWYDLTAALGTLTPGMTYVGEFEFTVVDTADGMHRQPPAQIQIQVLPRVETPATYDLTTLVGQTRLYCLDTDTANAFFSDGELTQFLADALSIPMLAAAFALEAIAVDQARFALAVKIGTFATTNASDAHNAIAQRAATLRALAPVSPVVGAVTGDLAAGTQVNNLAPDPVFTLSSGGGSVMGTESLW